MSAVHQGTGQIPGPIPAQTGIGLRACHHARVVAERPSVGWFEAHSENYFAEGGPLPRILEQVRSSYPLSLHGVGLGLGDTDPFDTAHVAALRRLIRRYEPALVSEHLSWSAVEGRSTNDLLPVPYTDESLLHLVRRIREIQDRLERQILVENVSSYFVYRHSTLKEWEFLAALARESGCGLLLDVNNVYVSACNHGWDAPRYLQALPIEAVQEFHLAGHGTFDIGGREVRIDTHDRRVSPQVWALYDAAIARFGPRPTLIEWDSEIPSLEVLQEEAAIADAALEAHHAVAA